jgi:predicted RNase H-like nuclease (RuvC/YqgF family)
MVVSAAPAQQKSDRMDFQQLEVLEEKIKKMLATMKSLQAENTQLTRKNDESEKTIHKLKQDLERSSRSSQETESLQEQLSAYKRERDEIKTKVEGLISHIEELEAKI